MQKAAATIAIRLTASARSSSRSAPATRSFCSPHCQMQSPAAAASVAEAERPRRRSAAARAARTAPASSTTHEPGGQRDHGREPGVVDVGGCRSVIAARPPTLIACATSSTGGSTLDLLDRRLAARRGSGPGQSARATMQATSGASTTPSRSEISRDSAPVGQPVVHRALVEAQRVEGGERDADRGDEARRRSSPGRRR